MSGYKYKRAAFWQLCDELKNSRVIFLLGPRKCGKTVVLQQYFNQFSVGVVYVDLKADYKTDNDRNRFVSTVIDDIENGRPVIYLIDEASYLPYPDKSIASIAGAYARTEKSATKVVFSGSQSKMLDFWGHLAFAGNASFMEMNFLTYPEWLEYKGITEITGETYKGYLLGVRDFYSDFSSTRDYLKGCLDETVISNHRSIEYVLGNDCDDIDVEMLLDVLYSSLIKLHNRVGYKTFVSPDLLADMLSYSYGVDKEEIKPAATVLLSGRYRSFKNMDPWILRQALQFLKNSGLISIIPVSDSFDCDPYYVKKLLSDRSEDYKKAEVFYNLNITMNYPMFFMDMAKDILGSNAVEEIPNSLLGSIAECHIRSLLPTDGCFEYHGQDDREIDYVSCDGRAMEISVTDKRVRDTAFDVVPEGYRKILLTGGSVEAVGDIERIPYYEFIYNNSIAPEMEMNIGRRR